MSDSLRVALVGYGTAGAFFHAPFLDAAPGLELAAVVTSDPGRQDQVRRRHPATTVVADVRRLWERADDLDVAVVATPNRSHLPLALAAVEAGLAVVVDKPVAGSVADAQRLQRAAEAAGRSVSVYQNRRWDGDFRTLRRLLDEGALGDVHRFESRFERWRPQVRAGSWKESPDPDEAGGILLDLGSHLVDQALVLFGPVRTAYAELGVRRDGARVADDVFVALQHASGTVSHLWMSAASAAPGPRLRVLGSSAAYVKDGMDVQESALRAGGDPTAADWGVEPASEWALLGTPDAMRPVPTVAGDYGAFYRQLVAHLREGAPSPVPLAEAVDGLRVLEAAVRSAAEGSAVAVNGSGISWQ